MLSGQKLPNMSKTIIVFACLVAVAASVAVHTGSQEKKVEADKEYLTKQKAILQLLFHVHQPLLLPELKEVVNNYNIEQNVNNYNDVECVRRFVDNYKYGRLINKREVFNPLAKTHVQQVKHVFEVLYNAKDWTTFYNTAVWMREHINDGVFVYAFSVAVFHRPDTKGIVLPPIYEVSPHLFVSGETIQKAYEVRMQITGKTDGKDSVVIPTNYTGWYKTNNPELRTSYFTEDVGLNSYHYYYHLTYPYWLKKEQYGINNERKGELFWYVHQQILAHYNLERFSNNMYGMQNFTFNEPHIVSYAPNLVYKNGQAVPVRPGNVQLQDYDVADIERVKDFERRIRDAIDSGYVKTVKGEKVPLDNEHGIDILGRLVEKASDSVNPRYYGALFQITLNLVGHIVDPYHANNVAPSTLQNFETMLRDPMYYRLFKRINKLFTTYKTTLPVYTKEKLSFPGVSVESVDVDRLMTYFENFDFDITNAVNIGKVEDDKVLKIVARQPRLNHKEFTYRINVNSDKDVVGMVRVFLGPKYDATGRELTLNEKKNYMVQIDRFPYEIKSGKTVIERNSKDSTVTVYDMTSFRVLYKQVEDALQGKSQFYINERGHQYGYPSRLMLPKGKKSGMPYNMYVVITPYTGSGSSNTETVRGVTSFVTCGGEQQCTDSYPMGFPFDREVYESEFNVPNICKTDVTIYHKKMDEGISDI